LRKNKYLIPSRSASLDEIIYGNRDPPPVGFYTIFWRCFNFHPDSLILPVLDCMFSSIEFLLFACAVSKLAELTFPNHFFANGISNLIFQFFFFLILNRFRKVQKGSPQIVNVFLKQSLEISSVIFDVFKRNLTGRKVIKSCKADDHG
jgi:hypothetical protein